MSKDIDRVLQQLAELTQAVNELRATAKFSREDQVKKIAGKLEKLPSRYFQSACDYIDFLAAGGPGGDPGSEGPGYP